MTKPSQKVKESSRTAVTVAESGKVTIEKSVTPATCVYKVRYTNQPQIVLSDKGWVDLQNAMLEIMQGE